MIDARPSDLSTPTTGEGSSVGTDLPLVVQFEYHPASREAADTADYLHSTLNDDPAVPGLKIPTLFVADDGTGDPPAPALATEAERVVVVLLADNHLAASGRRPTKSGITRCDYVVRPRQLCDSSPDTHRFLPVQLTDHGWPIDPRLDDLYFLRAWTMEDFELKNLFLQQSADHCFRSDYSIRIA